MKKINIGVRFDNIDLIEVPDGHRVYTLYIPASANRKWHECYQHYKLNRTRFSTFDSIQFVDFLQSTPTSPEVIRSESEWDDELHSTKTESSKHFFFNKT